MNCIKSVAVVLCLAVTTAMAQIAPSEPPRLVAHALETAPILDGNIQNDSAWEGVGVASGFWQTRPYEGKPASQTTEVRVGFTEDAFYVGVICYDDEPDKIVVSDSRRDSTLDDTDSFQIVIDGLRDRQNGLVFGTNPLGMEYDGQVTKEGTGQFGSGGGGFNINWDTTWRVKTRISEIGWSAEMEIPFRSLRYGTQDVQTWGINFQRNIRRNNEEAYWAPLPRQHNLYRVSLAGTLESVNAPPQRNLKITPYVLAKAQRGGELTDGTDYDEEFGFDLKYSLTPSVTLDATVNTDFAQVEVDELQVNLDRFSLFFPEKRPFFLENAGQFTVGTPQEAELFFSRRIGIGEDGEQLPIEAGVRLSGKVGRTNLGFLQMRSEAVSDVAPANNFSVARINQEFATRSSVGFLFVNRDGDGSFSVNEDEDYNRTYALDGRWGIGDNILISGWVGKTTTPGLEGKDHGFRILGEFNSEKWSNNIGYSEVGEDFNPEVGFLTRSGYRKGQFRVFRRLRPEDLWGLYELRPHISYSGFWNLDGFQESGFLHIDNHFEWKSGHEIHTGVNFTHEGVTESFDIVDGVTVPVGEYDHAEAQFVFITNQGAPLSASLRVTIGGLFGGDRLSLEPTIRYRFGEKFSSELTWDHNDIRLPVANGDFKINLARLRISYSFTPKMTLQALVQYDDRTDVVATNFRFAWLQSANAGFYLVYNEVDDDSLGPVVKPQKEVILKYSRIFDLLN